MLMPASSVILYAKWAEVVYQIRDTGPAGGLIFYVKDDGYSDGWMYLEAAPASTEWTDKQWGSDGTLIWETEKDIGKGQSNTTIIVALLNSNSETDCAAQLCDALDYGGYSDWFLPSKGELNLMYENLKYFGAGGFADAGYWSSSDGTSVMARVQDFTNGYQGLNFKTTGRRVRAVRAF